MFETTDRPRVFAIPPGMDFTKELHTGLQRRTHDPIQTARTEVFLNTQRMRHVLHQHFLNDPVQLLPRIKLVTEIPFTRGTAPVSNLERQLELADFVRPLLEAAPDMAPKTAAFDLAVNLSKLMDELAIEGVDPSAIAELQVPDESDHWARSLKFIQILQQYFSDDVRVSAGLKQRQSTDDQIARWTADTPAHSVIVAGSTGSRKTTFDLMVAAAHLPQGAIILPGFDWQAPWSDLMGKRVFEDHPQFRYAKLLRELEITADDVRPWTSHHTASRNSFTSLALRPAPITHHWMTEGPQLQNLDKAFDHITWLNAPNQRTEANTIAARLRVAAERGETAAVISPDRNLTRRIAAALSKWDIIPDDSAGTPLSQTPPGRFLLHVVDVLHGTLEMPTLLTLLKHPLCHSGQNRGPHLKHTRDLELRLRRYGPAFPDANDLMAWADKDDDRLPWVRWVIDQITVLKTDTDQTLAHWSQAIEGLTKGLSDGPSGADGTVWDEEAGRSTLKLLSEIADASDTTGPYAFRDFTVLLRRMLQDGQVTQQRTPHPDIMIWGTLEARVQSADVVILAGLNEGIWPQSPMPDPWMNRRMRAKVGLLNPDRNIGLSAHDFEIAFANKEVWVTRALRSSDGETVPTRWLNRMANLLNGLSDHDTHPLMQAMTDRGNAWMASAAVLDEAILSPKSTRPSPKPPIESRPRKLPVTGITTLIRDPYAIYAKYILGLRPLNSLLAQPDALLRGNVIHDILEATIKQGPFGDQAKGVQTLLTIAADVLAEEVPWPADRRKWLALMAQNADWFMKHEMDREAQLLSSHLEVEGETYVPDIDFTLIAKADRVDVRQNGVFVYDYKTGAPPSKGAQKSFDKQLLLEIELLRKGAFPTILTRDVLGGSYISMGSSPKILDAIDDDDSTWADFIKLINAYQMPDQSYTARRAPQYIQYGSDYDHLARFGEWDETEDAVQVDVP
ncbi:MAG: double-strand break repair protein AddB [Planktomarina sp.]